MTKVHMDSLKKETAAMDKMFDVKGILDVNFSAIQKTFIGSLAPLISPAHGIIPVCVHDQNVWQRLSSKQGVCTFISLDLHPLLAISLMPCSPPPPFAAV